MSSTSNFVQSEFRYDEGKSPLILLAETCRNIGLDTTSSKSAKSSIDHVKSSNNSSSLSSSSSSSIESSSSRKNNDSCRLSVSPLRNSTPINSTNRTSANSVNGSNNITITNHSSSSSSSSTDSFIGNNNNNNSVTTSISNSESNGCSFKPYEDHIISKKKCPDDSRTRSTPQNAQHSDNKSRHHHNNNKHYVNKSENISKSYESNSLNKRENVKSSSSLSTNVSNIGSSSSSSSTTTPSTSSTVSTSSSNTTSTSTVHVNHSSPSSKGSNCNDCLSPHRPSSKPYPLTVDSVSKYVPYPSLSPYLGLPPPNGYDPASVAAVAAAVAGHCHSPSMCRDPFCAGCRFNAAAVANALHHHQVSPCPAGCTQCSHVTSQMTSSISHQIAALQANGYLPGNSFYPPPPHPHHSHPANPPTSSSSSSSSSSTNSPQAAAAAAAAAAVAAAASASNVNGKPNVCSWMMGNTYCGKRFTSSEELQQHLRNHTSSVSALAFLGQYPHLDPMLTSPIAGLRRTTFVPVNRHHPYKSLTTSGSPLNTLTNGLTGAIHKPPPGSQLNMHYPPYGPYTGRLGPPILP
ncbi:uncharacterized protein DDB_G0271670-like [Panonychus citri]|uniref:uncharacterized protein DDB_G0271670-like n=1 Tax=Panonychus citri TaxID=50023 RepID=UPI002307A28C|nr:uncharacterized protein DDB_G0271670-like [Panonychus citri]